MLSMLRPRAWMATRAYVPVWKPASMPFHRYNVPLLQPARPYSNKPMMPVPVVESEGNEPLVYNRPQRPREKPWYTSPVIYVLGIVPLFTLWLGFWQVRRLKWKVSLINELDEKLRRAPLKLPKNVNMAVLRDFEFRLFELEGEYDTSRVLFVGPRTREGQKGYNVVMPFKRRSGGADILVSRGFVAADQVEGEGMNKRLKYPLDETGRTVRIVALMPRIYPPSRFALTNEPQNNLWMQLDPTHMAHWLNEQAGMATAADAPETPQESRTVAFLRRVTSTRERVPTSPEDAFSRSQNEPTLPIYMEEVFDGSFAEAGVLMRRGQPVGRPPRIELRNQHAEYAATWFTFSALSTIMFVYMVRKGRGTA